jgi:hypothetical protein
MLPRERGGDTRHSRVDAERGYYVTHAISGVGLQDYIMGL